MSSRLPRRLRRAFPKQVGSLRVELLSEGDAGRWNRFLLGHADATVSHLAEWRRVIGAAYGKACCFLFAARADEVAGVLPLVYLGGPLAGNRLVSMPFLDQGGIVADDEEAARALWASVIDLADRLGASGIDLRGPLPWAEPPATVDRFRPLVELPAADEELWASLGTKVRNQVRKSRKAGLATRRAAPDELDAFYRVLATNMRDLGSPVHARRFLAETLAAFGDAARLYLTEQGAGRVVAGGIALRFRETLVMPWASSLRSERSTCPNHNLYWTLLRDAIDDRLEIFDFGRSSAGTGTLGFKKQWATGLQPLSWSSFDPSGRPQSSAVPDPRRHARLIALWRHLPLPLANWLGVRLRHHFSN